MTTPLVSRDSPIGKHPGLTRAGTAALIGCGILNFVGNFSLAPALPAIERHFAGTPNADLLTGLIGGAAGFAFALGSFASGRILSRYGYRAVYLISLLLFGLVGVGGALVPNLYVLLITRVVVGIATSGVVNAAVMGAGLLLPPADQAKILGAQAAIGGAVGIAAFPLIGQLAALDWRLSLVTHLVALLFIPLVVTLPVVSLRRAEEGTVQGSRNVGVLTMAGAVFVGMVIFIATLFGPLYLESMGVTDPGLSSIVPMSSSLGSMVGSALYVLLRTKGGLTATFGVTLIAMALGLTISALTSGVPGAAVGAAIASLGVGAFAPNLNAAAIASSPGNPGPAVGLVNGLLYGSLILFPIIASSFTSALGGPRAVLLAYAVMALLLAVIYATRGRGTNIARAGS